jgi:light-regulated signal transduction histidine kinase (bacteriophytochrome)/CheY-like chemotaxis protein
MDVSDFNVDLANCDCEPIHVLGIIQPFGFLIALDKDWSVARVSANIARFTGIEIDDMLGRPISQFLSEDCLHAVRNRLSISRGWESVERLFAQQLFRNETFYDVAVHMSGESIVIEAEPASDESLAAASVVRGMVNRLGQVGSTTMFLHEGARQVRALTGFDRVMVYRFDEQLSGEVVAEVSRPGTDSFLGLRYPASDIPAQARKLYLRNTFRVIADIDATPVPIVPQFDKNGAALDQSLSVLRAVSRIHIEYLKNMGVCASLSISIVVGGKLWGLLACHHYSPRLPSFASRTAAELFGQMFSLMLESRERREAAEYETVARGVTDRMMASIACDESLLKNPEWLGKMIGAMIPSDGIGVYLDGDVSLVGLAPNRAQFDVVVQALSRIDGNEVFATDRIAETEPEAAAFADIAAGLIAIPLSRTPRDYAVLFRSERQRSVRWAGNPEKTIHYGPYGASLTPRKSFEVWTELVKGRCEPFNSAERRVAEMSRSAILDVLVRLYESAGSERQKAQERQELLIAELNHRVRNILSLIRGLINQSRDNLSTVDQFVSTLDHRIQALARAHDQITTDRWGPARLIDLIEIEASAYVGLRSDHVKLDGPNVLLHPIAFTTLALVLHELMTNAAKYGALSHNGTVTIRWKIDDTGGLSIDWTEHGGPAVSAPTRRGFGSTIIERSVPYDLGGLAEVNYRLAGLEAHFYIPMRHVAGVGQASRQPDNSPRVSLAARPLHGKTVLLVEDNMIIALDGEDALHALGAEQVIAAASVSQAISAIELEKIDFALLDFNLGAETSVVVAETLIARGIRFAFATGYGEGLKDMERFTNVAILTKPYGIAQIARLFAE